MRDAAANYHRAAEALLTAKAAHAQNVRAHAEARSRCNAAVEQRTRIACEESEARLVEAQAAAQHAHRAYWLERQQEMLPDLLVACDLIRRYDRIARCAGHSAPSPSMSALRALENEGRPLGDIIGTGGVPLETPGEDFEPKAWLRTTLPEPLEGRKRFGAPCASGG